MEGKMKGVSRGERKKRRGERRRQQGEKVIARVKEP